MVRRRVGRPVLYIAIALLGIAFAFYEAVPDSRELVSVQSVHSGGFQRLGYVPNLYAAYVGHDGRIFGIQDHFLYLSEDDGRSFHRLGSLPKVNATWFDVLKDRVARSRFVRRLRNSSGPTNLVVLSSGTILVFYDYIYRSTDGGLTFHPVFNLHGMGNAFGYGEGVAAGEDDIVFFGEYVTTARPHEVRILRGTDDGRTWAIAYTFPSGDIFHVHSIQYDPYRSRYWITTGDSDAESKVLYTDDGFKSIQTLGGGSQDWRVVSLMVTKDHLYWGSDNDREPAGIFQWGFANQVLSKITDIGKPSYFSTILKDGTLILSTTYEPESPYTRRYHPDPTTDLWGSRDGTHWAKILSLPYEPHETAWGPSRAAIAFPGGIATEELLYTPLSTKGSEHDTHFLVPRLQHTRMTSFHDKRREWTAD